MKTISDLWFTSFADSRLHGALWRLRRQAKRFGFDPAKTIIIDENGLDSDFREQMKDWLSPGVRGFGYWCWKPQTILQALSKMNDGDFLVYADAGCHLNPKGRERLLSYLPLVEKQGLGVFQGGGHETTWTKGDMLEFMGVRNDLQITRSGQIAATAIIVKKSATTTEFFSQLLRILRSETRLIDDTPSTLPNFDDFKAHRHDQSVFSILCKQNRLETFDAKEISNANNDGIERPIIAQRNLGIGWRGYVPLSIKRFCFKCKDVLLNH